MPPPPAVLLKTCCNRTLCVCERDVCNLPTTFNAKPAGKDGEKVQTTRLLLRFYAPEIPLGFEDSTSGRNCDSLENRWDLMPCWCERTLCMICVWTACTGACLPLTYKTVSSHFFFKVLFPIRSSGTEMFFFKIILEIRFWLLG